MIENYVEAFVEIVNTLLLLILIWLVVKKQKPRPCDLRKRAHELALEMHRRAEYWRERAAKEMPMSDEYLFFSNYHKTAEELDQLLKE